MPASLLKNSAAVFLSRIVNGGAGLGITLVVVRVVDVASFGRFALALAVGTLAAVLAEAGSGLALVREVSRDKSQAGRAFGTLLSLRLLGTLGVLLLGLGASFFFSDPDFRLLLLLGLVVGLLRSLSRHVTSLFYGFERMELETGLLILESVFGLGLVLVAAAHGADSVGLMASLALGYLLGLGFRVVAALRLLRPTPLVYWDREILRFARQQALGYGLFAFASMSYSLLDVPLVTLTLGDASTGIYQAAARILTFLMLIPEGLGNALLPAASREKDPMETASLSQALATVLAALSLPTLLGGALLATPLMLALFGQHYGEAGAIFAILLISVPLRFHSVLLGTLLTAFGRQKQRAYSMLLAALLLPPAIALGAYLGSLKGVALARLTVELALLIAYGLSLGAGLCLRTAPRRLLRTALALGMMGLAVYGMKGSPVFLSIAVGALVYGSCALILGVVPPAWLPRVWPWAGSRRLATTTEDPGPSEGDRDVPPKPEAEEPQ